MNYGYYNYYATPIFHYVNMPYLLAAAVIVALVLGIVLFFTFLKKNNEGKYSGLKGKFYNAMTFNRFYAENIIKFVYVLSACVVTVTGLVQIVIGSFIAGIITLVLGNVILRISFELLLMFIILCKKTVSMDRRISKIEAFYDDQYGEDWGCDECADADVCCDECADADVCCDECAGADVCCDECITDCGETENSEQKTGEETEM